MAVAIFKWAQEGNEPTVKRLLTVYPAALTLVAKQRGQTALHIAAECGHEKVVNCLLLHGAPYTTVDRDANTALHLAAAQGHVPAVKVLLRDKYRLAHKAKNGDMATPLHVAVRNGHAEVAGLLVAAGARGDVRDKDGLTPIDLAGDDGLMLGALMPPTPQGSTSNIASAVTSSFGAAALMPAPAFGASLRSSLIFMPSADGGASPSPPSPAGGASQLPPPSSRISASGGFGSMLPRPAGIASNGGFGSPAPAAAAPAAAAASLRTLQIGAVAATPRAGSTRAGSSAAPSSATQSSLAALHGEVAALVLEVRATARRAELATERSELAEAKADALEALVEQAQTETGAASSKATAAAAAAESAQIQAAELDLQLRRATDIIESRSRRVEDLEKRLALTEDRSKEDRSRVDWIKETGAEKQRAQDASIRALQESVSKVQLAGGVGGVASTPHDSSPAGPSGRSLDSVEVQLSELAAASAANVQELASVKEKLAGVDAACGEARGVGSALAARLAGVDASVGELRAAVGGLIEQMAEVRKAATEAQAHPVDLNPLTPLLLPIARARPGSGADPSERGGQAAARFDRGSFVDRLEFENSMKRVEERVREATERENAAKKMIRAANGDEEWRLQRERREGDILKQCNALEADIEGTKLKLGKLEETVQDLQQMVQPASP